MIGPLKLVFDQHPRVSTHILAENIGPERPDLLLLRLQLKFDTEGICQDFQILDLSKPRREPCRLTGPDGPKVDAVQTSKQFVIHLRSPVRNMQDYPRISFFFHAAESCRSRSRGPRSKTVRSSATFQRSPVAFSEHSRM